MFMPKRKAIIICMLVTMISVVPFLFLNKLSCPSSHYLSLFLEFVILTCDMCIAQRYVPLSLVSVLTYVWAVAVRQQEGSYSHTVLSRLVYMKLQFTPRIGKHI